MGRRERRFKWVIVAVLSFAPWWASAAPGEAPPSTPTPSSATLIPQTMVIPSAPAASASPTSLYDVIMPNLLGRPIDFKDFKGQVVMVVNIAADCTLPEHISSLQKLYEAHWTKGFQVIAVGSEDFSEKIGTLADKKARTCHNKHGATFPIMAKSILTGENKCPLYKFLAGSDPGTEVKGLFEKFLISREGKVVAHFAAETDVLSPLVEAAIEKELENKMELVPKKTPTSL